MIHCARNVSALYIDVIVCYGKTQACSVVQECFVLLLCLCTAGVFNTFSPAPFKP
jgi:hypothetical protein